MFQVVHFPQSLTSSSVFTTRTTFKRYRLSLNRGFTCRILEYLVAEDKHSDVRDNFINSPLVYSLFPILEIDNRSVDMGVVRQFSLRRNLRFQWVPRLVEFVYCFQSVKVSRLLQLIVTTDGSSTHSDGFIFLTKGDDSKTK